MWVKNTCCNSSLSYFNQKLLFTMFLYWCSLIPVCRLQSAEGYNLLSFSSFSQKGATNPLALVLADVFTSTQVLTYRRLQPSLFFQGPRFINFQTTSINNINLHQSISFAPTKTESIKLLLRMLYPEYNNSNQNTSQNP